MDQMLPRPPQRRRLFWPLVPILIVVVLAAGLWVWQNSRGSVELGRQQLAAAQYERAIGSFSTAIANSPNNAENYGQRGLAYAGQKEYSKAIDDYTKAIKLGAAVAIESTLYNNRGLAYFNTDLDDLALADFDKAIELKADYAIAYFNRGVVKQRHNKNDEALVDYNKAIELDPQLAQAYVGRAQLYLGKGDTDQALANYDTSIKTDPNQAVAYHERASIYLGRGDAAKAMDDLRKAVANARPEEDYLKFRAQMLLETLQSK